MSLVKAAPHRVEIGVKDVSESIESPLPYESQASPTQSEDNFVGHSPIKGYDQALLSPMTEKKSEEEATSHVDHSTLLSPLKECESPSAESFVLR